jgi:hypothetical protein
MKGVVELSMQVMHYCVLVYYANLQRTDPKIQLSVTW